MLVRLDDSDGPIIGMSQNYYNVCWFDFDPISRLKPANVWAKQDFWQLKDRAFRKKKIAILSGLMRRKRNNLPSWVENCALRYLTKYDLPLRLSSST